MLRMQEITSLECENPKISGDAPVPPAERGYASPAPTPYSPLRGSFRPTASGPSGPIQLVCTP